MGRGRRNDPTLVFATDAPARPARVWLVVAPGTAGEQRVAVGAEPISIGKDAGVDLRIADDPHVSGRHAEVVQGDQGLTLRDLGSTNGTHVAGVAVKEVVLRGGVTVVVGRTSIRVDVDRDDEPAPQVDADAAQDAFGDAIGRSAPMRRVFALLARVAPADLTVTLLGETGTGKDVLARAIHAASPRRAGPMVVFDCGAVAPTLIESELFGHERGAFTGATNDRPGAFERAGGGTLFLDEIGELSLELQPKLLRALEQRRVTRLGGGTEIAVDVRIVAATSRDLEAMVRDGRFRQDLYFRLAGAVVPVPPLRERRDDLPLLVDRFLAEQGGRMTATPAAVAALAAHDWPGNVRELKNVLVTAAALADGTSLEPRHFITFAPRRRPPTLDSLPLGGRALDAIEKATIVQTLRQLDGNKTKAARALGIAPSTLYEKIKKYGL